MQGRNNQKICMLLITRMTAMSVPLYVTLQEAMTMMVDCGKGTRDCATQQPTKSLCCITREQACCKPPRYVLYKCTYLPYDGTFDASDQCQTLDVWGWHPADVNAELVVTPDVTTSSRKIPWTSQDISVGISADLLDHTGWIQGWIQFNGCSVRQLPYSMWLLSQLMRWATSVFWA